MGTPTNRTPVRVARGSTTALNTGLSDIQEGEIVWDTTLNKLQVKEGSALEDHTVAADATKANLSGAAFTGAVSVTGAGVEIQGTTNGTGAKVLSTGYQWPEGTYLEKLVITGDGKIDTPANVECGGVIADAFTFTDTGDATRAFAGGSNTTWGARITDSTESGDDLYRAGFKWTGDLKAQAAEFQGNVTTTGNIILEGATADAHETTLAVTDPTADRTITFPDATGTVALTSDITVTLSADQNWTGAQRGAVTALTDGATIAVDFNSSNNYSVTLAGNRTLGQPTNQVVGQSGSIFITQDGTGSRTLAYHADWKWAGGTAPTLTTTAAAVDRIDYIVAAANKIHAVATLAVA